MTATYILDGLSCANCAAKIEAETAKLEGVKHASVNLAAQRITITGDSQERLNRILDELDTIVKGIEPDVTVRENMKRPAKNPEPGSLSRIKLASMIVGVLLFAAGFIFELSPIAELAVFLASYLIVGGEVLFQSAKNIARGQVFDENFLMSVASIGAFAIGEYPEGAAVMIFYQIGEAFQDYAVRRSRRSISELMDIRPDFANVLVNGEPRRVAPEDVNPGDFIVVKPGEKIPLDGTVSQGSGSLDVSALTGEAMPRDVEPGSDVLSGSINKSGLLTIEVKKPFGESTVAKILDLVQNAGSAKAPIENFITKFARYYTPAVVIAAVALAVITPMVTGGDWSKWLGRALVFLVVSCPCALVISIPMTFFGGIGAASRSGILIKGANYLDALNNADTIVFDKTGTLTIGVPVLEAESLDGEVHMLAASLEQYSTHPVARAVCQAYGGEYLPVSDLIETAGIGISGIVGGRRVEIRRGDIYVDGVHSGRIKVNDPVKIDSKSAISALKAMGVRRTAMLTGDTKEVGEKTGREVGLDLIYAQLLPHEKVERLEILMEEVPNGGKLIFTGDGINDAPVLARADVGIAMGGVGSDAAIEAADIVLMTDEPSKIAEAIRIAKRTRVIVTQNIVFALVVKAVILILGALGLASMWAAVFGDVGVAVIAIINAMRALRSAH